VKKNQLLGLHLVRGLCAIAVMAYHYAFEAKIGTFFAAGTYGVYVFFVLSGFALMYVYGDDEISDKSLHNFFIARLFRIVPLYATVVSYQLIFWIPWTPEYLSKAVLNFTMVFGLFSPGATSLVPGGWSIGVEFVFYALFPIVLLFRSWRSLAVLFVVCAIVSHAAVTVSYAAPAMAKNNWAFYIQAPTFLVYFIGGALIARIHPLLMTRLQQMPDWNIVGTLLTLVVMAAMFALPHAFGVTRDYLLNSAASKIMIAGALLVILLASTVVLAGVAGKIAVFLGEISFALYLCHYLVWVQIKRLGLSMETQIAVSAAVSLAAAYGIYRLIERPARGLRTRFMR